MSRFFFSVAHSGHDRAESSRTKVVERLRASGRTVVQAEGATWWCGTVGTLDDPIEPTIARAGPLLVLGDVRLDNRTEVREWARAGAIGINDLQLVAMAIVRRGRQCIAHLVGDFAILLWDEVANEAILARDACGVMAAYYRDSAKGFCAASHASDLADDRSYDLSYLAEYTIRGAGPINRTAFQGVEAVSPGSVVRFHSESAREERYWNPETLSAPILGSTETACETFLELFSESVRSALSTSEGAWVQLSGGVDSSAIACTAATLVRKGCIQYPIQGALTLVDTLGAGNEEEFARVAARACSLPVQFLTDYWMWQSDDVTPQADQPTLGFPFFARDRAIAKIFNENGGRLLLSGHGPDHLFATNLLFLADNLVRGQIRSVIQDSLAWARSFKISLWGLLLRNAMLPHVRRPSRSVLLPHAIPAWLLPAARKALIPPSSESTNSGHMFANKYKREVFRLFSTTSADSHGSMLRELIPVRFPFLYRPLVEFALQLPHDLRSRPGLSKWILREAMRGILPEVIRVRKTKASIHERLVWSLRREKQRIDEMLDRSVLGELGCVDVPRFKVAVEAARQGDRQSFEQVFPALTLETWLSCRAGRWRM
jgi:asparagine synthase (glutamine-hydrolysing)